MNDIIKLTYREGEEIKTMEFDENGDLDVEGKGMLQLKHKDWEYRIIEWESAESEDITKKVNPLYLEVIEEQECPHCEGEGEIYLETWNEKTKEYDKIYSESRICPDNSEEGGDCTDGKVETLTLKVLFKPKEYDREIQKEWHDLGVKLGKGLKEGE